MNKQHKWHKEIKAWADGAEIEVLDTDGVYRVVYKPNWGVSGAEFRIKPQPTISYKETIVERLRTDDEFWNEVFNAYDKKCDNEKPQPKEPQYLYVYDFNGDINFLLNKTNNAGYIGKIKLEVED